MSLVAARQSTSSSFHLPNLSTNPANYMSEPSANAPGEPQYYGGYTRFELELEVAICSAHLFNLHKQCSPLPSQFVQCLANPWYLNHLASQKLLDNPEFIAYLDYLQYFSQSEYTIYLNYPGPTFRALQLLQHERFRKEILMPDTVMRMIDEGVKANAGDRP